MTEIKGLITKGGDRYLNCCDSLQDLNLNGKSLYDTLQDFFNQNEEDYFNDGTKQEPKYQMRYVILDNAPLEDKTFEELSATVVIEMLYCEYISGCYSEWTCGMGGFNYVINHEGHSIFKELESHVGKYVHICL